MLYLNPTTDGRSGDVNPTKKFLGERSRCPPRNLSFGNIELRSQLYQLDENFYIGVFVHFHHPEDDSQEARQKMFEKRGTIIRPIEEYDVIASATMGPFSSEEAQRQYRRVEKAERVEVHGRKNISLFFEEEVNIEEI